MQNGNRSNAFCKQLADNCFACFHVSNVADDEGTEMSDCSSAVHDSDVSIHDSDITIPQPATALVMNSATSRSSSNLCSVVFRLLAIDGLIF